jgi:hypothetical protein
MQSCGGRECEDVLWQKLERRILKRPSAAEERERRGEEPSEAAFTAYGQLDVACYARCA